MYLTYLCQGQMHIQLWHERLMTRVNTQSLPDPRASANDRLRWAREQKYDTAASAAAAMGINYQTYVAHENAGGGRMKGLPAKPAQRYSEFFKISLDWLLTGKGDWQSNTQKQEQFEIKTVPVVGITEAGAFREAGDIGPLEDKVVSVPLVPGYASNAQFAVLVRGNSMNIDIRDGDYAICLDYRQTTTEIKHDDIVVAQLERAGIFETTIKIIRKSKRGELELWPASTDPKHQDVVQIGAQEDGATVSVIGLVIGVFRDISRRRK